MAVESKRLWIIIISFPKHLIQIFFDGTEELRQISVAYASGCNMTAINECIPILSKGTDIDMVNEGISAIPSADQLKKICGMLGEYEACYLPKAAACVNDVVYTMTFGTIQKTIDYLCVEGYVDILKHESCWNKTAVTEGTKQCHDKQTSDIRDLRSNSRDRSKMKERWCQILENTTACVENIITTNCGVAPACIMKTMLDRALVGLSGLMKCAPPPPCNTTTTEDDIIESEVFIVSTEGRNNIAPFDKPDVLFVIFSCVLLIAFRQQI